MVFGKIDLQVYNFSPTVKSLTEDEQNMSSQNYYL